MSRLARIKPLFFVLIILPLLFSCGDSRTTDTTHSPKAKTVTEKKEVVYAVNALNTAVTIVNPAWINGELEKMRAAEKNSKTPYQPPPIGVLIEKPTYTVAIIGINVFPPGVDFQIDFYDHPMQKDNDEPDTLDGTVYLNLALDTSRDEIPMGVDFYTNPDAPLSVNATEDIVFNHFLSLYTPATHFLDPVLVDNTVKVNQSPVDPDLLIKTLTKNALSE